MENVQNQEPCGIHGDHDDRDIVISGTPEVLEAWRRAFRVGIAPQLTRKGLQGLAKALAQNDARLLQGATTSPPPLQGLAAEPVQKCCPLCFALLDGKAPDAVSVGEMEFLFAAACWETDKLLGEPGAFRYFLNAVDEWTREQLIANLLPEVRRELVLRHSLELENTPTPQAQPTRRHVVEKITCDLTDAWTHWQEQQSGQSQS